jgi:2-oxoisovalerate ferredoxin oxidoreductase beta subunit
VATGVKRALPHSIVISYQGDGDLAAIGGNEIIQAANRGESISVFFVNNAIYGMTGGQMAPTTLVNQKTTTTPYGRNPDNEGFPMHVSELLSAIKAPVYIERCTLEDTKGIMKTRKAVRKALQNQIDNKGFSLVEILSPCPTGWKMEPVDAREWVAKEMAKVFPLGVYKDEKDAPSRPVKPHPVLSVEEIKKELGFVETTTRTDAESLSGFGTHEIRLAGFGGQGILLLGQLLTKSGMYEGKYVSWLPSYGPEMRGGTANCHVVISENRIGAPYVASPSLLVAMNQPSLEKFAEIVRPDGLILYDSSFVKDVKLPEGAKAIPIPFSAIANDQIGNARVANIVAAGAIIGLTNMVSADTLRVLINELPKKQLIEANMKALEAGLKSVEKFAKGVAAEV